MSRQDILDQYGLDDEEVVFCDGFDDCIIGVVGRFGAPSVIGYDFDKMIASMIARDGMTYEEAEEFFEFNILGAYVGEYTPVFISLLT